MRKAKVTVTVKFDDDQNANIGDIVEMVKTGKQMPTNM